MTFCVAISVLAISGAMVLKSTYEKKWNDPVLLANAEALAQIGDISKDPEADGGSNNKVCYYKGTTTYSDYYSCESNFPSVGACGNTERKNMFFSVDKFSCTM